MKYFCVPALVSLAIAFAVLVGKDAIVLYGTMVGFVFALVTLAGALACIKAHRNLDRQAKEITRVTGRQAVIAGLGSGVILLGYVLLALTVLGNTREVAKSAVSASNLRGIGIGLKLYSLDHNDYPASFEELVTSGHQTWGQFWAMGDPDVPHDIPEEQERYSSFVYQPGAGTWRPDAEIILSYEREAWTPLALRVFPSCGAYGRHVLFGDGRVRLLADEAFRSTQQQDMQKRTELGWPPPANE